MKSSDLMCLVCGAPSTGFNFSVITCMCCKAFFRRNALYGLESYQCRYLAENCTINMRTRRDCSYCRLKKCFEVGMKKELILTDDIKRLKREKITANRKLNSIFMNRQHFSIENDLTYLKNISNIYEEYCRSPIMTYEKREYELVCHLPIKTRIKHQHYFEFYQKHKTTLFNFFQHLPDFQQFSIDEQKALYSHNTRFLLRLNSIETMDDSYPLWGAINLLLEMIYGKSLIESIDLCLHQFKYRINDSRCIQLILIISLFSTSMAYNGNISSLILFKIQEKYTNLLWSYLQERYGELIACQKLSQIIHYCLHLQTINHLMEMKIQDVQWQELLISTQ
ncbi:unnamed protein product [Adineta steineri]|uniref:Nuclear receptor domain-containing protein n=1 Tax=Adineta steineri TaxID=433720 RepID=A0A819CA38_9BILA|nr:unnamed protein product [Adineta steineri]CAF1004983.1 unnamed protein product [Adineta steineri]CAF3576815.1 unnamed protein product [Adineta steineri]CAF3815516.1 unnamed protein product [Adineta steineri]